MVNLVLIVALLLPFQIALNPSEGIDLASIRAIIIALFFLWLAIGLKKKRVEIKKGFISALILIFLFINLASIIVSRNTDWSIRKLLFIFSIFPIYFLVSSLISNSRMAERTTKFLVFGGSLAAMVGIVQFFLQFIIGLEKTYSLWAQYMAVPFLGNTFSRVVLENPSWLVNISGKTYLRAVSVFPDPHMLSFYLGLLMPLSLGMALKFKKPAYFFSFGAIFLCNILTFSRGGYVGLLAGLVAILFVFWSRFSIKYKIASFLIATVAIGILFFPGPVSNRLFSSLNLREGSNMGRLEMWEKAYAVSLSNPLLGVGIGNYPLEVKPSADYREPIYAHNTYLDIASESGILNAFVWIAILAMSIAAFIKKAGREKLFLWLAIGLIIFSVHSMFETALYSPTVLTLLLFIISFANIDVEKCPPGVFACRRGRDLLLAEKNEKIV
jgi:O-antigen ligase